MKKLTRVEMRNIKGGTSGNLWTCNWINDPTHFITFCHAGNPSDDPTCTENGGNIGTCTEGATCSPTVPCP